MAKKSVIDQYPQYLNFDVTESAANTYTEEEIQLPIPRLGTMHMVMEILKIYFHAPVDTLAEDGFVAYHISYKTQSGILGAGDSDALMAGITETQLVTSGGCVVQWPQVVDLTDGSGHGVLVSTDKIFLGVAGAGQAGARRFEGKLLYRFVAVSAEEYIGIVQSQT